MIRKRGDKWAVTIYDPETKGKTWVGTYVGHKEAVRAEAEAKLKAGEPKAEAGETCDQFADRWLRDYPRQRQATNIGYEERVSKFKTDFTGVPLEAVTRVAARRWALDNPSRHRAVRAMFSDARRDGLIDTNPFLDMRLPQTQGRKYDFIPSMEQVAVLARHARRLAGPNFEAFILTAAYTGMRPGELYALKWKNIRLEDMEIDVISSYSSKSEEFTKPKNGRGRAVSLPPLAKNALEQLPQTAGFVFETITGKWLTGKTIHYQWDPVRNAAGFPGLDLYTLRHACGSHLLNDRGLPAHMVAEHLGHTDGGVLVMKLYGHPSAELARKAIKESFAADNVVPIRREASGG